MLRLEKKTGTKQKDVVRGLKRFFGKEGLGLSLEEDSPGCLTFVGGGGFVRAELCRVRDGIRVDLTTREWESQVREFASLLH